MKYLLRELKLIRKGPLRVWWDNHLSISIANNLVQHDRFLSKEKLYGGIISLTHVSSMHQILNCLTMGLGTDSCIIQHLYSMIKYYICQENDKISPYICH
jgi:hypothetical protein